MPGKQVLPIKKWLRNGSVGVPGADAAGIPDLPCGILSYLPLEIRDEIWRHLLLLDRNVSYPELRTNRRGNQIPPERIYDFDLNMFRVSKAIYEEASRVFYDENLFVRLSLHDYGRNDRWYSVIRQNFHHSTLTYFTDDQLKRSQHHAMDVDIYQISRAANSDSGKLITYMIPFSRLVHLLGCLSTMAIHCVFDDQHFTRDHGISLTVRSNLTNPSLHAKLLAPFTTSFGFRAVEVTGVAPDLAASTASTLRSSPVPARTWLAHTSTLYTRALTLERTLYDRPHIIWRALSEVEHHVNLLVRDSYASPRTSPLLQHLTAAERQSVQDMLFWTNVKRAQYFAEIGWKCENGWGDRCYKAAAATVGIREMVEAGRAYLDVSAGSSGGGGGAGGGSSVGVLRNGGGEGLHEEDEEVDVGNNVWLASGPKKGGYEYADDQKFALYCLHSRFMLGSGKVRDAQRSLKKAAECLARLGEPPNLAREYKGVEEEVNAKGAIIEESRPQRSLIVPRWLRPVTSRSSNLSSYAPRAF